MNDIIADQAQNVDHSYNRGTLVVSDLTYSSFEKLRPECNEFYAELPLYPNTK